MSGRSMIPKGSFEPSGLLQLNNFLTGKFLSSSGCFGWRRHVPVRDLYLDCAIRSGELGGLLIHGEKKRA
jgi:hypothetical protein